MVTTSAALQGVEETILRDGVTPTGIRAALQRAQYRFRMRRTWNGYSRNLLRRWDAEAGPFHSDFVAARKVFS